jgi:RND family efflux transporter MFP subunit
VRALNKKILLLGMVLMFVFGVACNKDAEEADSEVTANTYIKVSKVTTDIIEDKVLVIGKIEAKSNIKVSAKGQGDIEEIYVKTGDKVSRGQRLFRLDNDTALNSYNATESQLRTIRDNLQIRYNDLEKTFSDTEKLYNAGAVSKTEYDNVKSSLEQLKKQYDDSVIGYNNQVNNLKVNLNNRTIASPITGKIGAIYIKEGEATSGDLALEVIDDTAMVVKFDVTTNQLGNIEIGDETQIYPDGEREMELLGKVVQINEIPNASTGLYEITSTIDYENSIEDRKNKLFSGEYAELLVMTDKRESIVIPKEAVRFIDETDVVFVVDENNKAATVKVGLGTLGNENYEVNSGLSIGDEIITTGQTYLSSGDLVIVSED